eukprot:gene19586-biopygen13536
MSLSWHRPLRREFITVRGKYVFYDDDGVAHVIESADGVDQGGPLSPPAFAFGLRRALRRIRARLHALHDAARDAGDLALATHVIRLLSYLDDLTVLVPEPIMGAAMGIAEEELRVIGLTVNHGKTMVWTKSGRCPPRCERWWKGADGFVFVGAPYGRLVGTVDADATAGEDAIDHEVLEAPEGTPAFCKRFLDTQTRKVQDLLDRIVEIPALAGAHQPAVQTANLLL